MKVPPFAAVRGYLLLIGGLLVIAFEVVVEKGEKPTLIVAALLMMGISVPLHLDGRARAALTALQDRPSAELIPELADTVPLPEPVIPLELVPPLVPGTDAFNAAVAVAVADAIAASHEKDVAP